MSLKVEIEYPLSPTHPHETAKAKYYHQTQLDQSEQCEE